MRIVIETIPHEKQPYDTCGDWRFDADGVLQVRVSETGDDRFNLLVGLHEAVEAMLCQAAGVTQEAVDAFDTAHLHLVEPGEHPDAPYRVQHGLATEVEVTAAAALGVSWPAYEQALAAL